MKLKYWSYTIFIMLLAILSCNSTTKREANSLVEKSIITQATNPISTISSNNNLPEIKSLDIIVVQCANGYEYALHNYDFNPVIEKELNRFENINVKPFPFKALLGVSYQGVFDKKYCAPIIEKVDIDYLILTRFSNNYNHLKRTEMDWGYELRIVNTTTLEQINSIGAKNLKGYEQIKQHIRDNIAKLRSDIERFK